VAEVDLHYKNAFMNVTSDGKVVLFKPTKITIRSRMHSVKLGKNKVGFVLKHLILLFYNKTNKSSLILTILLNSNMIDVC